MTPVSDMPAATARALTTILCDIDDTLTTDGRLPASAYAALERLQNAGLRVVPVTGRPAGWCDHIARMWPVDGIVGENGAFAFRYDAASRRMQRSYWRSGDERRADRERLDAIAREVLSHVPGAAISADQAYREADLAIDFCEDVDPLPAEAITDIVRIFEAAGAVAKISSIHVNGWFGDYDKLSMSRRFLADAFGIDIDRDGSKVAFAGDSPNDEPMFAFFENGVGVANIRTFTDRMTHLPRWITSAEGGQGFAEFAEHVITARG
jgi:HAD superfamily hydrolase (TIGR01484 family)